jgi:hypothetical protein
MSQRLEFHQQQALNDKIRNEISDIPVLVENLERGLTLEGDALIGQLKTQSVLYRPTPGTPRPIHY